MRRPRRYKRFAQQIKLIPASAMSMQAVVSHFDGAGKPFRPFDAAAVRGEVVARRTMTAERHAGGPREATFVKHLSNEPERTGRY
jgi:hypothetical protein